MTTISALQLLTENNLVAKVGEVSGDLVAFAVVVGRVEGLVRGKKAAKRPNSNSLRFTYN